VQQQVLSDSIYPLFLVLTSSLSLLLLSQFLVRIILIKSCSSYYFVDSKFVDTYHLKISATPSVALYLFDEPSNNTISKIANLPIIFPTGDCMTLDFDITLLNSFCFLVLGYNWLNPLYLKSSNSSWLKNCVVSWLKMIKKISVERVLCWIVSF